MIWYNVKVYATVHGHVYASWSSSRLTLEATKPASKINTVFKLRVEGTSFGIMILSELIVLHRDSYCL